MGQGHSPRRQGLLNYEETLAVQGFERASETLAIIWSPFNWVLPKKAPDGLSPDLGRIGGGGSAPVLRNDSVTHGPVRVSDFAKIGSERSRGRKLPGWRCRRALCFSMRESKARLYLPYGYPYDCGRARQPVQN